MENIKEIKQIVKKVLRRLSGKKDVMTGIEANACQERLASVFPDMTVLEGTVYSRYLMPLEYPPSRRFAPRWGYSHAPVKIIEDLFATGDSNYIDIINGMRLLAPYFNRIPENFKHENLPEPAWLGVPISPIDTAALYYFICHYKPKIYMEIGSGVTTCFAKRAIKDHGLETRVISIDPEPRAAINSICDHVVRDGLETVDLSIFDDLVAGDIVFLDGSHRAFMNSDVTVFMIDVLPTLKPGVIIHIHDILLPYDYPDSFKNWYWNEQYMVATYLIAARERIAPLFPSAYVTKNSKFASELKIPMLLPSIQLGGGGSLWFTHKI